MRTLAATLLLTLVPSLLAADKILIVKKSGEHVVFDTVTNEVTPAPYDAVYVERDIAPDPPDDPDDPDPPKPTDLKTKVKQWTLAVGDPDGVAIYGGVYGLLADQIESGAIPATTAGVQKGMLNMLSGVRNFYGTKEREWNNFTQNVADELTRLFHDSGQNLTKAQYVDFFRTVQDGMEAANEGKALGPFVEFLLQAIFKWILSEIPNWFADAGPVEQQDRFAQAPEFEPRTLDEINAALREMAIAEGIEAP